MKDYKFKDNEKIKLVDTFPEKAIPLCINFDPSAFSFSSKFGEILHVFFEGSKSKLLVNSEKYHELNHLQARKLGGFISNYLISHRIPEISITYEQVSYMDDFTFSAFFEGLFLGGFEFDDYKNLKSSFDFDIYLSNDFNERFPIIENAQKIAFVVNRMRNLGQQPANVINPDTLSEICKDIANIYNLNYLEIDHQELNNIGANGILAVGNGSKSKPRIIFLEYNGNKTKNSPFLGLVGKAITFDTGGYSIKSVDGIKEMKYDKLGGLTVIGTMMAASLLKLPIRMVGAICVAENMISDHSYRPDDIITTLSGKTVEIITTDAEGRLVLADGFSLLSRLYNPPVIIDFATLTGGIVTALGKVRAGIFSNNKFLTESLLNSGEITGEKLWEMPLDDDYFEFIKGDYADLKNSGGKDGHPIMGGIFLKQFVPPNTAWAHIDIAGTATNTKADPINPKGANGFGIRLMINYLQKIIIENKF